MPEIGGCHLVASRVGTAQLSRSTIAAGTVTSRKVRRCGALLLLLLLRR